MFNKMLGRIDHQLDEKGRMRIPAKFRDSIGSSFTILPGKQECVYIVSNEKADTILAPFLPDSPYEETDEQNELGNAIISNMAEVEEDAQGRFVFPKQLAQTYKIRKDVVVIGKGTYLEVWGKEVWDARYSVLDPDKLKSMLDKLKKREA